MAEAKQSILKSKIKSYSKEVEKELLGLAVDFIKTEAGERAIGTNLDVNSLENENGQPLTSEELQNRLKSYIPEIEYFQINGRLYDSISGDPITKAKVQPLLALGDSVQTDKLGQFTIVLGIPILPYNQKALLQSQLIYNAENYIPDSQTILTSGRQVKTDLKTRKLIDIEKASKEAAAAYQAEVNGAMEKAKSIALSATDKVLVLRRKSIQNFVNTILFKLIPLAIGMLLLFGITKLSDLNKAICPTPDQLKDLIRRRNRLVRQINQLYKAVAINTALAALFTLIATNLKGIKTSIELNPVPVPLPPAAIFGIQIVRETIQKFIDDNKNLNKQLLIGLVFLVAALIIILLILKAIDKLIFECSEGNVELDNINEELRNLEKEAEANAVTPSNQINGFTIEVETIDQNAVGDYKRKQAVGKNSQGIILIKGDPSFSAGDTVLINELAYYIQSNDLKAY